jgi:hypothetical protein
MFKKACNANINPKPMARLPENGSGFLKAILTPRQKMMKKAVPIPRNAQEPEFLTHMAKRSPHG